MLKKFILFVCCFTVFAAGMSADIAAAEEDNVLISKYDETAPYITVLKEIGVLQPDEAGDLKLDYELNRMDFAHLVCRMFNANADSDIEVIKYVMDTGIMVGSGDNFRGGDSITYDEAAAVMIKALGYGFYAENSGGYPSGYLKKAAELGILNKLENIAGHSSVSRGYAARLIFNTMCADMPKRQIGSDFDFTPDAGNTIFSTYHSIYEKSGQVTANEFTVLYGTSEPDKNQVAVLDEIYDIGDLDLPDKLGYTVNIIYKDDEASANRRILCYELDSNNNYDITIDSEDIESIDENYITYYEGSSRKRIKNDVSLFVYNGKVVNIDYSLMIPGSGSLTLIGTHRNEYSIAIAHDIKTYVVNGTVIDKEMVFDKLSKSVLMLDGNDKKVSVKFSDSSSELSIDALQENDVLAVEESDDGRIIKIVVYRDNFYTGIISGRTEDEYIVDGYNIKISKELLGAFEAGNSNLPVIQLGRSYKVLLNDRNEIAFIIDSNAETNGYGYLLRLAADSDEEEKVYIEIFTASGSTANLELAQRVKLNGYSGRKPSYVLNAIGNSGSGIQQVIYYQTNSDGDVNVLETAVDGYDRERFSCDYASDMDPSRQLEYYSKTFGHRYTLKSGGVIFQKNPDVPGVSLTDRDIKVVSLEDITAQKAYYVDVYDAELSGEASLLVITQEVYEKLEEETAGYLIISSFGTGLNSEEETLDYIVGSTKDEQNVKLFVSSDVKMAVQEAENLGNETHPYKYYSYINDISDLKRGDVIRYTTNAYGEINVYGPMFLSPFEHPELVYEDDAYIDTESAHYAAGWTAWCHMYDVTPDFLSFRSTRVAAPGSNGEKVNSVFVHDSRTPVYLCDRSSKDITKITCNDIVTLRKSESAADNMLIRVFQGMVKFIVIYR
ncbi:MAG: hypothetical protein J6N52_03050 [Clostridia bacterium]|nr:hypothetical protein [Clostridia bacterium]